MRRNNVLTIGFLAAMAATVAFGASDSFAQGLQRVDVIDNLPAKAQMDSVKTHTEGVKRVDVIDTLEARGPVSPPTAATMRVDVIGNIRPS